MAEHEPIRAHARQTEPSAGAAGDGAMAARLNAAPPVQALADTARKLNAGAPVVQAINRGHRRLRVNRTAAFATKHEASADAGRATAFNGRNPAVVTNTTATRDAWKTAVNAKGDEVTDLGGAAAISVQGSDTTAGAGGALAHTAVGALNKTVTFTSDNVSVTLKHVEN